MDSHYGERKRKLLKGHPETILEIGAAYGANFRYLRPGTKLIVFEPNESYNQILHKRARRFNIDIEIHNSGAENIELPSDSIEMVLGSLVLCTVELPEQVLKEIHRVLRKQGKFVFLEHVKAGNHSWLCRLQKLIKKPWKWFFDGCVVNRDTGESIKKASFESVDLEQFNSRTVFLPIIPHIAGVAKK